MIQPLRANEKETPCFLLHGVAYTRAEITALCEGRRHESAFAPELLDFLREWFSSAETMRLRTSGSTGKPKILEARKSRMEASARLTCAFLGLQRNESALLCMPLKYIGAKMVVVRSLVAGLDLWSVTPSGHPLQGLNACPVFAAMTPAQVYSTLESPTESALLRGIKHLIIGGGAINAELGRRLRDFPGHVWSTYGMTETLSHIALRRLNGPESSDWYAPFDGVTVRLAPEGTLIISAPAICDNELHTTDLAELDDLGRFRILGRSDNVVNSGGIKIQIEAAEEALTSVLNCPFMLTSIPDSHFGEVLVLLLESAPVAGCLERCRQALGPYTSPKRIFQVSHLPCTGSGKPDRAKARELASQQATSV